MPLGGNGFAELAGFMRGLKKLPDASREIAIQLAPKTAELVGDTMAAQTSPTGEAWQPTKSGAPAFGGSSALGFVLSRLSGKASVRTTVLYPLHFHQDGTHKVGRKRGRAIARGITSAYAGNVLRQMGLAGSAPRRRKDESDGAYQARVEKFAVAKSTRKDAITQAKRHARSAVDEARTAGGWHDPPRPMIPDEGDPIPSRWEEVIRKTAAAVMLKYGATER
jgi:hypothetical protein